MATPEEVKVILKKLAAVGAIDKDIEALVQALEGSEQIKVQIAKYINNVNQAQDSQFGNRFATAWSAERVDQDVDVEASHH